MTLTLSTVELEGLVRTFSVLVSPLDHESVDGWRSAVNAQLAPLLGADSAGFLLSGESATPLYSDEHDPAELARFSEVEIPRLPNGQTPFERLMEVGEACTLRETYAGDPNPYFASAHYNELAAPNRAHDTLSLIVPLDVPSGLTALAGFLLWHERPAGRLFGVRERQILTLLAPALKTGAIMAARRAAQRPGLLKTFDELEIPALSCGAAGGPIHVSMRLERELEEEADAARLLAAMYRVAGSLLRHGRRDKSRRVPRGACGGTIVTDRARYAIHGSLVERTSTLGDRMAIVGLERLTPVPKSTSELRSEFGLSAAEIRVATALAHGFPNDQIAKSLHISPHTARRHTESILMKVRVRSRAELIPHLLH